MARGSKEETHEWQRTTKCYLNVTVHKRTGSSTTWIAHVNVVLDLYLVLVCRNHPAQSPTPYIMMIFFL
jgi:two-component SAPR family response regulator